MSAAAGYAYTYSESTSSSSQGTSSGTSQDHASKADVIALDSNDNNTSSSQGYSDSSDSYGSYDGADEHTGDAEFGARASFDIGFARVNVSTRPKRSLASRLLNRPAEEPKRILKNASGKIRAGKLTMLLGPSQSGKSVLLDLVSGRLGGLDIDGTVTLNHMRASPSDLRLTTGYVQQEDILNAFSTPRENLSFLARLQLPRSMTAEQRRLRVEQVLETLGIAHVGDTIVGIPGMEVRGLSGGERRRAAIAQSVITAPPVLIVDEPTAGLDAASAVEVIRMLRRLAHKRGMTVFSSISQPSIEIWNMFDDAICLSRGHVAYCGPVKDILTFLKDIGHPCPEDSNPAEFTIDLLSHEEDAERAEYLINTYAASQTAISLAASASDIGSESASQMITEWRQPTASLPIILWELLKRNTRLALRNKEATWARTGQMILFALLIGAIFWQMPRDQGGVRDRQGFSFLVSVLMVFSGLQSAVTLYLSEIAIYKRERLENIYGSVVYLVSRLLADLPFQVFFTSIFSLPVYWMTGLVPEADNFFIFVLVCLQLSFLGSWLGLCLGAATGDADTSNSLAPAIILPSVLFSGMMLQLENLPQFLVWLRHLSLLRYGVSAMYVNEFQDITFSCGGNATTVCPIATGKQFLVQSEAERDGGLTYDILMTFMFMTVIAFLCWVAMWSAGRHRK